MANMFSIVMKNLFSKKQTRSFPLGPEREIYERSRGRILMEPENCILCSICAKKCPADAITVNRSTGMWELNAFRCILCGECVSSCPKKCITMSNERRHGIVLKEMVTIHKDIPKPAPRPAVPSPKPVVSAETAADVKVNPAVTSGTDA